MKDRSTGIILGAASLLLVSLIAFAQVGTGGGVGVPGLRNPVEEITFDDGTTQSTAFTSSESATNWSKFTAITNVAVGPNFINQDGSSSIGLTFLGDGSMRIEGGTNDVFDGDSLTLKSTSSDLKLLATGAGAVVKVETNLTITSDGQLTLQRTNSGMVIGDQNISSSDVVIWNGLPATIAANDAKTTAAQSDANRNEMNLGLNKMSDLSYNALGYEGYAGGWIDSFEDAAGVQTNSSSATNLSYNSSSNFFHNASVVTSSWSMVTDLIMALKMTNNAAVTNVSGWWTNGPSLVWETRASLDNLAVTDTPSANFDGSWEFNGSSEAMWFHSDSVNAASAVGTQMLAPGTNSWGWSIWVNRTDTDQMDIYSWVGSDSSSCRLTTDGGASGLKWVVRDGDGTAHSFAEQTLSANAWHHIVVQRSGPVFSYWIDGSLKEAHTNTAMGSFDYSGNQLTVGAFYNWATYWFGGYLADLRNVYGRAFSSDEIIGMYNSGSGDTNVIGGLGDLPLNLYMTSTNLPVLSAPSSMKVVLAVKEIDDLVLNTDIFAGVSADGVNFSTVTLSEEGQNSDGTKVFYGSTTAITNNPGTQLQWQAWTENSKRSEFHGFGTLYE